VTEVIKRIGVQPVFFFENLSGLGRGKNPSQALESSIPG